MDEAFGIPGKIPILQVGGEHEAEISAPPGLECAVAEFVPVDVVRDEKDTTSGFELVQVKGGLVRV
jgi:hypothetical protein